MSENWLRRLLFGRRPDDPTNRTADELSAGALSQISRQRRRQIDLDLAKQEAIQRARVDAEGDAWRHRCAEAERAKIAQRIREVADIIRPEVQRNFNQINVNLKERLLAAAQSGSNSTGGILLDVPYINNDWRLKKYGFEATQFILTQCPGYAEFKAFCKSKGYRTGLNIGGYRDNVINTMDLESTDMTVIDHSNHSCLQVFISIQFDSKGESMFRPLP